MNQKDIIVIGGGPTGSTVASYLTMKGYNVTVFEKEKFPRPHVGESLLPFNYHYFKDLGVLDKMERDYHRKPGVKFSNNDGSSATTWYFDHVIKHPSSLSFHVDRAKFDKMLLDRSKELGALVFEETMVKDVDFNAVQDKVIVYTVNTDGTKAEHMADFLIDASGQNTFMANKLKNKNSYEGLDRVAVNTHWENPTYDKELSEGCISITHLGGSKMGWIWAIPISDKRLSVGVVMSGEYFKEHRKNAAGDKEFLSKLYLQELSESTVMSNVLKEATMERAPMAHGDYSYYTNEKYSDQHAIIGDASAFLDPIFSSGIYIAMASAKMLSEKLDDAFQNNLKPSDTVKQSYEQLQDAYDLIEKLIRIWYDPEAISLSELNDAIDVEYDKFHKAYEIYHYLLQGDFLVNAKKYSKAADILKNTKNLEKYSHFVKSKDAKAVLNTSL
jgi:flavin-dependent dehydrogenase